jgi:hypothetical protein
MNFSFENYNEWNIRECKSLSFGIKEKTYYAYKSKNTEVRKIFGLNAYFYQHKRFSLIKYCTVFIEGAKSRILFCVTSAFLSSVDHTMMVLYGL